MRHPAAAADLVGTVTAAAADVERERRLPGNLLDALRDAGCFRLWSPRSHGGEEVNLPDALEVIGCLARGDGSVAWSVAQAAMAHIVLARFPRTTIDTVYASGPDVIGAGAVAPKGKCRREPEGWRVSGRWPYATNIGHASWFYGQCLLVPSRGEVLAERTGGPPHLRTVMLPTADVDIHDTWHSLGLRGTGSHDVAVSARGLDDGRVCDLLAPTATLDGPLHRVPTVELSALVVAACLLGTAHGALEDLACIAREGGQSSSGAQGQTVSEVPEDELGQAHLELLAGSALLSEVARRSWTAAVDGLERTPLDLAVARGTARHASLVAGRVVEVALKCSGSSGIYDGSPLQRRFRDVKTGAQHGVARPTFEASVGAALIGKSDRRMGW